MTTVMTFETRTDATDPVSAPRPTQRTAGRRLIGVGVRDVRHDAAALRWAVYDARPGRDTVKVVHACAPAPGDHLAGWDVVSTAVRHGSEQRPTVGIIGSPSAGAPEQVLRAESDEVALLCWVTTSRPRRTGGSRQHCGKRHIARWCVYPGAPTSSRICR